MKPRMTTFALFALAALAPAGADAQEPRSTVACPNVTVSCPDQPSVGKTSKFTANVTSGDLSVTPTFKWTVSGGKIISGQGADEIMVDAEGPSSLTAAVEVGGYPAACQAAASCTIYSCGLPSLTRKVDEYGDIKPHEEKTRLGSFAQELLNEPTAQGYVMAYAGRRARRGEALARGARAVRYLVDGWGLDARRLVVIDSGHRHEPAVELYLVNSGGIPPPATPTVEPAEVEIIKDGKARRARGRQTKRFNRR